MDHSASPGNVVSSTVTHLREISSRQILEALFNRALILERMSRPAQAAEAWRRYLEVDDAADGWAAEARAHLAALKG